MTELVPLYCCACGQVRTMSTTRPHRSGDGAMLTCFRCAGTVFTTDVWRAPRMAATVWLLTRFDRELLRSLRIGHLGAAGATEAVGG